MKIRGFIWFVSLVCGIMFFAYLSSAGTLNLTTYILHNESDSVFSSYRQMKNVSTDLSAQTSEGLVLTNGLIQCWSPKWIAPAWNARTLVNGTWNFSIYQNTTRSLSTSQYFMFAKFIKVNSTGEFNPGNTSEIGFATTANTAPVLLSWIYALPYNLSYNLSVGERIGTQICQRVNSGGSSSQYAYIHWETGAPSFTQFPSETFEALDNSFPLFSNFIENPVNGSAYVSGGVYRFNTTVLNTNGTVGIEFNGVNYTSSNLSAGLFNFSISNLGVGDYNYYWWGYGNGTSKNFNSSEVRYYSVVRASPNLILKLNDTWGNISFVFGGQVNASAVSSTSSLQLLRDGVDVTSENNQFVSLGVGYYNYTAVALQNQNYSYSTTTLFVNVTKANINLNLTLNGVSGNLTIEYLQQINVTAFSSEGSLNLFRDGVNVNSENGLNVSLGAGYYQYFVNATGNQNYSDNSAGITFYVNVTPAVPVLNYLYNGQTTNLTLNYPQQINISANTNAGTLNLDRDGVNVNSENGLNITLGVGYYNYRANITGNQNYSDVGYLYYNVTINKANQSLTPLLNGVNSNLVVDYPQQINASYTGNNKTAVSININGTSVSLAENYTLGAGSYVVNYTASENQNYSSFYVSLNLTINKIISQINLTLNNSESNISIVKGTSILLNGTLITGDNSARILMYLDNDIINNNSIEVSNLTLFDSAGLFNVSVFYEESQNYSLSFKTYFVNVSINADNEYSLFSNFIENPVNGSAYVSGGVYRFNTTVLNTNGTVGIEFNGVNYTSSNLSAGLFNFSISNLGVGDYNYYWWGYGNGTSKNFNSSEVRYYSVVKASPNLILKLNDTSGNISFVFGGQVNASAVSSTSSLQLLRDGVDVTSENNQFISLGVGYYNYTAVALQNQNYSSSTTTLFVNVTSLNNSAPIIHYVNIIVNDTNSTPSFGDNFFIRANVSDIENDSLIVRFTLVSPNGTRLLDNVVGNNQDIGGYILSNSTNKTVDDYGYWNWSVLVSDNYNQTEQNGSFRVLADLNLFPSSYIVAPEIKNKTLIWNLSAYHDSLESYNFTFSYDLNSTFFSLGFANGSVVLNKAGYNSTNLFKNGIVINISSNILEGITYFGNITIQRTLDGKNYTIPMQIGIDPPSGIAVALDTPTLEICSGLNCYIDTTMENDESREFTWTVRNDGGFALTNCNPSIDGFNINGFGNFNLNNFDLNINQSKELTLAINNPPINSYYGKVEVVCGATSLGFNNSIGANSENSPSLRLIVTADSGGGGSGSGNSGSSRSSGGSSGAIINIFRLEGDNLDKLNIGRGKSEAILWKVKNSGNKFLNGCLLSVSDGVSDWFSTNQIESLSPGQEANYVFSVSVPVNVQRGEYYTNLGILCKETSLVRKFDLSVVAGEFELVILNSVRLGTKLQVEYSVENFEDREKKISLNYKLVDSKQRTIVEGKVDEVNIGAKEQIKRFLEFELPKNSIGDYNLIIDASDGSDNNLYEQRVRLTSAGISGFAISDNNLRAISWLGIVILLSLVAFIVVKVVKNQMALRKANHRGKRQFITLDLND